MRRLVVVLVVLAAVAPAHAERKRQTAQILSGAGTAVSSTLILSGFLFAKDGYPIDKPLMYSGLVSAAIAPSLGEFYAGQYITYGMAARVLAAGLATYALTHFNETTTCDNATMTGTMCTSIEGAGLALLGVSAIAFIGGMAYDVDDAGPAVDRYNRGHGLVIAPAPMPTPTGPAPGLWIGGTF
jgi:hypothetical protein